jgi:hypothetical protein
LLLRRAVLSSHKAGLEHGQQNGRVHDENVQKNDCQRKREKKSVENVNMVGINHLGDKQTIENVNNKFLDFISFNQGKGFKLFYHY